MFFLKKIYIKNYDAILLSKYDLAEKKILNYAYVLKNGVGRHNIFFLFLHKAGRILLFVSFSCRIHQCFCSSMIRFVHIFFINKQFCANAFPNEFTVRSYEYCSGQHWILSWMEENQTVMYFLRSRLFTYDIMKNLNCN